MIFNPRGPSSLRWSSSYFPHLKSHLRRWKLSRSSHYPILYVKNKLYLSCIKSYIYGDCQSFLNQYLSLSNTLKKNLIYLLSPGVKKVSFLFDTEQSVQLYAEKLFIAKFSIIIFIFTKSQ